MLLLLTRFSVLATVVSAFSISDPSSRLCQISVKSQRSYDVSMQLVPEAVDPVTASVIIGAVLVSTKFLTASVEEDRESRRYEPKVSSSNADFEALPSPPESAEEAIETNRAELREKFQNMISSASIAEDKKDDAAIEGEKEEKIAIEEVQAKIEESSNVEVAIKEEDLEEVEEIANIEVKEEEDMNESVSVSTPAIPRATSNIGAMKMQVASTLKGEQEKTKRLQKKSAEQTYVEKNDAETTETKPEPELEPKANLEVTTQGNAEGTSFMTKVVKKAVMPWRKFSNL